MPDRIRIRRQQDATILRVERPNKRTRLRVRTTSTGTGAGGGGAVDSVNGQTGVVVLDAGDVGALPDDTVIPDIAGLQATSEKNQPNGYAGLDGDGTIPDNRIPSSIARDTEIGTQITAHDGSGTAHSTLFAGKVSTSAIDTDNTLAADSDTRVPSQKAVKAALAGKLGVDQSVNAQTGTTYTLVAADATSLVTLSNAAGITLTLPQDSDATIAVGSYVDLMQLGAGQVTVVAGPGATLRTSGLTAKARAQYSRLGVQKIAANTFSLFGDLAAS